MKPILCAAFAAAFVTAILANDDPLKAVPAPAVDLPVKPAVPAPAVDLPVKPSGTGLNEILRAGKLPVIGNIAGPFSGKLTLLGDDGKKREIIYKNSQIVGRTEWHENGAVRVESDFSHGVEIKRTGWRGDKKWFEIEFTIDEALGGQGKPVPPLVPAKSGTSDGQVAPAKPGTTDRHGAPAKPGTTDGHGVTDTHGSAVNTAIAKPLHKWPAFVPGSPDFPAIKTLLSGEHGSVQSHEAVHAEGHSAAPAAAQGTPAAHDSSANHDTPTIEPVPKSVGPVAELRADHLVYVRGSALPYTGNTTLFDENGKKMYEGDFLRGRREGKGVEWYATGQKKSEGEFRSGSFYEGSLYWYFIGTARKKMQVRYSAGKVAEAHMWNRNGEQRW